MSAHQLRPLSPEECRDLLRAGGVGRVGVSVFALPAIFPVRFTLLGDDVVFRTAPTTLLASAAANAVVAFEADRIDDDHAHGWSVLVVGLAEIINDANQLHLARALPLAPWVSHEDDYFTRIATDRISGRMFESNRSLSAP